MLSWRAHLPLSICPSFLVQISSLDTCFPTERSFLQHQCAALEAMRPGELDSLLAPMRSITLPLLREAREDCCR